MLLRWFPHHRNPSIAQAVKILSITPTEFGTTIVEVLNCNKTLKVLVREKKQLVKEVVKACDLVDYDDVEQVSE